MTHRVVFAPEARDQLIAVYDSIAARSSPDTAYAFTTAIMEHCEGFTTFPHRGTRRDDLRPGLRGDRLPQAGDHRLLD